MSKFLYQSVLCNFSPITVWLVIFWRKNIEAKRFLQNVGEIDCRDQFYQHTRSAFLANSTWQTAHSYGKFSLDFSLKPGESIIGEK